MKTILNSLRIIVKPVRGYAGQVLVVNRFRVPAEVADGFREDVTAALALLAARDGYLDGRIGRNVDDPELWVLSTRWVHVGAYRRALSSYDVKVGAVPLLSAIAGALRAVGKRKASTWKVWVVAVVPILSVMTSDLGTSMPTLRETKGR